MLGSITKTSFGPTGCQTRRLPGQHSSRNTAAGHLFSCSSTLITLMCLRYIDSQHRRVMQDIVSSKLYTEQFDAIQDCFRIIGFTEEVTQT